MLLSTPLIPNIFPALAVTVFLLITETMQYGADTGYVAMALGSTLAASNALNAGTITADRSFFVAGDNGAAKMFSVNVTGLTGGMLALART